MSKVHKTPITCLQAHLSNFKGVDMYSVYPTFMPYRNTQGGW
jgi:hypothetical protein